MIESILYFLGFLLILVVSVLALVKSLGFAIEFDEKITLHEHSSKLVAFCVVITTYSGLTFGVDLFAKFLGFNELPFLLDVIRFIIGVFIFIGLIHYSWNMWKHRDEEREFILAKNSRLLIPIALLLVANIGALLASYFWRSV